MKVVTLETQTLSGSQLVAGRVYRPAKDSGAPMGTDYYMALEKGGIVALESGYDCDAETRDCYLWVEVPNAELHVG